MMSARTTWPLHLPLSLMGCLCSPLLGQAVTETTVAEAEAEDDDGPELPGFDALKELGASTSRYRTPGFLAEDGAAPQSDLASFRAEIEPILTKSCLSCHGPDKERGGVRVDTLDPDLVNGEDVDWWLDVLSVLSNGEMPPEDEGHLDAADRGRVIEWLATEVQVASAARRDAAAHSTLRRMTRYEYEYALQDLFGLPFAFADDLPPDPTSEDGFQNSSELLHLTPMQLRAYLASGRKALMAATVTGDAPAPLYWDISMDAAAQGEWGRQNAQIAGARKKHAGNPKKLEDELKRLRTRFANRPGGAHYESLATGRLAGQTWHYNGAKFAWAPEENEPHALDPVAAAADDHVAVLPRQRGMIVEVGKRIPDHGTVRVRVLASRADAGDAPSPSLRLAFGWRASNDSRAVVRVSETDLVVDAAPGAPEVYEFLVPMREVSPRNGVRKTAKMGALPSPSEYFKLINASLSAGAIRVHHVQITAPLNEEWPPASHLRIFPESEYRADETRYAAEVLASFLPRAWRRPHTEAELQRKLDMFTRIRPDAATLEDAMIEVLATVLSSPQFLYVGLPASVRDITDGDPAPNVTLATRLSMFLWCSTPDDELLALAESGALEDAAVLDAQVQRMLADPRADRLSKHFVRQWLGMSLLDYLHVDKKAYPKFSAELRASMAAEPVAFFQEVLREDLSTLEFLHADFALVDERLARHYGLDGVTGNAFQRVATTTQPSRGGLLTQAGLLAMNSDGKDSHPLKRGVWLLERLLDDPPPPPPPAVPEIDLADPEIAKLTLKQRIEDHRDDPACMSCHAKIDPWGIAFENYDATGSWRTEVQGRAVDARSVLFNGQELNGVDGLKRFLLEHRQDQFVRAMVHKLTSFALGRPLSFEDRAAVDGITAEVRKRGDGLATMVTLIATSELFRTN